MATNLKETIQLALIGTLLALVFAFFNFVSIIAGTRCWFTYPDFMVPTALLPLSPPTLVCTKNTGA